MNWFGFEWGSFLIVFVVLNVINVVLQTIKSIATVKCGKWGASSINAIAYALYTVVVVYMNADGLGIFWKAVIIGLANLVGVYAVKVVEEKNRKDRLWRVEATVRFSQITILDRELKEAKISHNYITAGKYGIFNCYCNTQSESLAVKGILAKYHAKYFVSESKTL